MLEKNNNVKIQLIISSMILILGIVLLLQGDFTGAADKFIQVIASNALLGK
jgi:hypothetical protein